MSHPLLPKNLLKTNALFRQGKPDYTKLASAGFPSPTVDEAGTIVEDYDTGDRYRWTGTIWVPIGIAGRDLVQTVSSGDLNVEIARGKIPDYGNFFIAATSTTVSNAGFTDVWDPGGVFVRPVAAESYEIVSANANDTAAGTGAQSVLVISLDAAGNEQFQVVATNGGTVAVPGTHLYPRLMLIGDAGAGTTNAGNITLQVAGGGAIRGLMVADEGASNSSHFQVPAGKIIYPIGFMYLCGKNEDIVVRPRTRPVGANSGLFSNATVPLYQNGVWTPVLSTGGAPAGNEALFQAKSSNVGPFTITILAQYRIVDA